MAVTEDSDEEKRGIQVSDVIVSWGSKAVNSIDDLENCALSSDQPIAVIRKQRTIIL